MHLLSNSAVYGLRVEAGDVYIILINLAVGDIKESMYFLP